MIGGSYTLGETIVLEVEFTNEETGALTDPAAVVLHVKKPDGSMNTYPYPHAVFTKTAVGLYEARIVATVPVGTWIYEFEGNERHRPGYLKVKEPAVA